MTKEEAIKIFNTMLLIIKAVEQKISLGSVDEVVEAVKMAISSLSAEQTAEYFTFEELESWLFENALNNLGNVYGESVEELISRLDGFKEFVKDRRVEQAEISHNSTENNDNDLVSRKAVIDKAKIEAEGMTEPFKSNFAVYVEWLVEKLPAFAEQTDYSIIAKIKKWSELPEYSEGERNVMKVILQELEDTIPQTDSETEYWKDLAKSYERTIVALQKGIAETQTNTAEWIFTELVTGRYKCSHCRGNADRTTRFCPYCGYLMSNYNGKAE